jgi:hypothetical protein
MSQPPPSPVKDKNYDLITVLQRCLKATWRLETYKEDARRGDPQAFLRDVHVSTSRLRMG